MHEKISALNDRFRNAGPAEVLAWFAGQYPGKVAFSTSLGAEDQYITYLIASGKIPVSIFTLDTGRMFQETYDLLAITRAKYGLDIQVFFPDRDAVEQMVAEKGINLFYESVENRKRCCNVRKIGPITRALQGMEVWITGMRRDQSVTRTGSQLVEWEPNHKVLKVNPIIDMTWDQVLAEVKSFGIPVNELHAKGYPSIGCLPCTRPVGPGDDIRSGRWWWEMPEHKECGLHGKK